MCQTTKLSLVTLLYLMLLLCWHVSWSCSWLHLWVMEYRVVRFATQSINLQECFLIIYVHVLFFLTVILQCSYFLHRIIIIISYMLDIQYSVLLGLQDEYYCAGDVALPLRWCSPETLKCTDTTIETKEVVCSVQCVAWNCTDLPL